MKRTKSFYLSSFKQKYPVEKTSILDMGVVVAFLKMIKGVFHAPKREERWWFDS